ncbi:MAG: T9SS type A sorting domain-containing protein [Prevotellaceae bacterium]|jgi:hypothetical protein|nr:T9SS type A sorting domain-containing protein [Prevotellaceae bacterium]
MKRIFIIILCFTLYSYNEGIAQSASDYTQVTNVRTPNNSIVQGAYSFNGTDDSFSSTQISALVSYLTVNYGAELISLPTYQYNCHAYAWHVSEGGNNVWIGLHPSEVTAEDIYWTDGSYVEVPESIATKVSYHQNGNHSAVRLNSTWYQSKWGSSALVKHHPNDVPPIYQASMTKKYYIKMYITGPTTVCNAGSSITYTIANKPANATVTWSCSSNLQLSSTNGSTSNSANFLAKGSQSAWVQAVVNIDGTNSTLPQFFATIYDFAGLLTTGGQSRTLPAYGTAPTLISTGTTDVILNSLLNTTLSWSLAPGSPSLSWSSSGGTLIFYTLSSTAVYHFIATMQNSVCGTKTAHYYFSADPSVTYIRSLYNPQSNILTVDFADELQAASESLTKTTKTTKSYIVRLFDFYGSLVKQGSSAGESISWNLSGQANGIYIVNIYDANTNSLLQAIKFIKK